MRDYRGEANERTEATDSISDKVQHSVLQKSEVKVP